MDRAKRLPVFTVKYEQSLSNSEARRAGWHKLNRLVLIHKGLKSELEKDCETLHDALTRLKLSNVSCVIGRKQFSPATKLTDLEQYKQADSNIYVRVDCID